MQDLIHTLLTNMLREFFVTLPATVQSYDNETLRAIVKPTMSNKLADGSQVLFPKTIQMPVCFPAASGCRMTWPLQSGDSGVIMFSSRDTGSTMAGSPTSETEVAEAAADAIAGEPNFTFENYNDAFFLPTIGFADNEKADPDKINIAFGKSNIFLSKDDKIEVITESASLIIDKGVIAIAGDLTVSGKIVADGDVTGAGISLSTHKHTGVHGITSGPL